MDNNQKWFLKNDFWRSRETEDWINDAVNTADSL